MKENRIKFSDKIYKSVTFKQKTNPEKSPKKITSTFEERNNKLVELINELRNKLKEEEEMKMNKRTHNKKQIEKNNKEIIERLYEEIEKIKENSFGNGK